MAKKSTVSTAPAGAGVAVPAAPEMRKRRVYLNGKFAGVHEFPPTGSLNDHVYQSLLAKMPKEQADRVTITVLRLPEDGSRLPEGHTFKKGRPTAPVTPAAAPATEAKKEVAAH